IIGAVPVFSLGQENQWGLRAVMLAAIHINDEYIEKIATILNVEAAIVNLEEQVVATTLLEGPAFQDSLAPYRDLYGIYSSRDDVYLDYDAIDGVPLRMIRTRLILNDNEEQGFLFVARSF